MKCKRINNKCNWKFKISYKFIYNKLNNYKVNNNNIKYNMNNNKKNNSRKKIY